MNSNYNVSPCPFCGGKAKFITLSSFSENENDSTGFTFEIKCEKCKISTDAFAVKFKLADNGAILSLYDGRREALQKWNNRVN